MENRTLQYLAFDSSDAGHLTSIFGPEPVQTFPAAAVDKLPTDTIVEGPFSKVSFTASNYAWLRFTSALC